MKYKKIIPKEYAQKIKKRFLENPALWYDVILPKEKAEELREKTNGDYSVIWHEHCDQCWKTLNSLTEICYQGEDGISWLCEKCYREIYAK